MSNWQKVKIGDFLKRIKRPIKLEKDKNYKLVTIKMHHDGIVLREEKQGSLIKSNMYEVHKGDFILSGIDARNGAFGIIPEALDKAIVTNDFWYFELDENIVNKYFFLELTATSWFDDICKKGSDGTTQRIRLQKDKFFNQEIVLPPLKEQIIFIKKFKQIKSTKEDLESETSTQQSLLKQLKQTILQEAIEGKLTEKWRAKNPDIGTAKELLEQIKTEKEQLVKDKKIKASKPLAPINEDEIPFDIPSAWEWCRFGKTIAWFSDYHANGSYKILKENVSLLENKDYAIMLRTTNFHEKNKNNFLYIDEHAYNFLSKTKLYPEDIIMNKIADPGRVFFVEDLGMPMSLAMNLFLLRFNNKYVIPKYVYYYLLSNYEYIFSFAAGSSTLTITKDAVNELLFTLPPLEEQKEIVATIEKLFAICDELEGEINQNKTTVQTIMATLLKEAFGDENV
ncbi:restriction endonuclease subunit S [Sulfurimonas sp.]|uniref:restriction endonuclease subunit S n=1 Tax=Sulfurimonas sp. TaxID=2022749 RepID=UPI0025D2B99D|nr:restriction endonuclease subunit S [Sulfurimonas sp.]